MAYLQPPHRTAPIHAEAPEFTDMSVEQEILVTGIKVVDLLAPYAKGGKIGKGPKCLFLTCSKIVVMVKIELSCYLKQILLLL